jgi:hypothetical protein
MFTTTTTTRPAETSPVAGTWLAVEIAGLEADPTAVNCQLHLIFNDTEVPGWHLTVLDVVIGLLGYDR